MDKLQVAIFRSADINIGTLIGVYDEKEGTVEAQLAKLFYHDPRIAGRAATEFLLLEMYNKEWNDNERRAFQEEWKENEDLIAHHKFTLRYEGLDKWQEMGKIRVFSVVKHTYRSMIMFGVTSTPEDTVWVFTVNPAELTNLLQYINFVTNLP